MKNHPGRVTTPLAALILLATIAFTQQVSAVATTTDPIGIFTFSQNRQLWQRGDYIRLLQKFLNARGFIVAQSGLGSPGNESTLFGLRTYRALVSFQAAHALPATGFFGPLTRATLSLNSNGAITGRLDASGSEKQSNASGASLASTSTQPIIPMQSLFPLASPGFGGGGADTTPPVIIGIPSNITAEATSGSGAVVTYAALTANDNVDGSTAVLLARLCMSETRKTGE